MSKFRPRNFLSLEALPIIPRWVVTYLSSSSAPVAASAIVTPSSRSTRCISFCEFEIHLLKLNPTPLILDLDFVWS